MLAGRDNFKMDMYLHIRIVVYVYIYIYTITDIYIDRWSNIYISYEIQIYYISYLYYKKTPFVGLLKEGPCNENDQLGRFRVNESHHQALPWNIKGLIEVHSKGLEGFISMLYKLCFNSYDQKCPNVISWVSIYMTKLLNLISFDQIPLWDFLIVGGFPSDFCPEDTGSSYRLHSTGNLENHAIGGNSVMFLRLCHTQGYTLSATILGKLKSTERQGVLDCFHLTIEQVLHLFQVLPKTYVELKLTKPVLDFSES